MHWQEKLEEVVELTQEHLPILAMTGAGISVASGIPDFRSSGGLWEVFNPMDYASIRSFQQDPARVWEMFFALYETMRGARPNAGHHALASLQKSGLLGGIVTQNIDYLHQDAGCKQVVEFHGNGAMLECLYCGFLGETATFQRQKNWKKKQLKPPVCPNCNRILKPSVILFGEAIPTEALEGTHELVRKCGCMWVIGTSAEVAPASLLPKIASTQGLPIIEINLTETELTHSGICALSLHGPQEKILPMLVKQLLHRLSTW